MHIYLNACTAALPIFTLFFKDLIDGGFGGAGGLDIKKVEDTSLKFLYISLALLAVRGSTLLVFSSFFAVQSRRIFLECR
jgi:hypothetical protein